MTRQYQVPRLSKAETTHSAKMIETREAPHTAKTSLTKSRTTLTQHRKHMITTLTTRLTTDTKHCNPRMKMKIKM